MKVVINTCFGGYSLSAEAQEALAERKGVGPIHWFEWDHKASNDAIVYRSLTSEQARKASFPMAYLGPDPKEDEYFECRPENRSDPDLVAVVEELGEKSWGRHAELKVVEVPDGVEYWIDEYDGREHVAEKHRIWS